MRLSARRFAWRRAPGMWRERAAGIMSSGLLHAPAAWCGTDRQRARSPACFPASKTIAMMLWKSLWRRTPSRAASPSEVGRRPRLNPGAAGDAAKRRAARCTRERLEASPPRSGSLPGSASRRQGSDGVLINSRPSLSGWRTTTKPAQDGQMRRAASWKQDGLVSSN